MMAFGGNGRARAFFKQHGWTDGGAKIESSNTSRAAAAHRQPRPRRLPRAPSPPAAAPWATQPTATEMLRLLPWTHPPLLPPPPQPLLLPLRQRPPSAASPQLWPEAPRPEPGRPGSQEAGLQGMPRTTAVCVYGEMQEGKLGHSHAQCGPGGKAGKRREHEQPCFARHGMVAVVWEEKGQWGRPCPCRSRNPEPALGSSQGPDVALKRLCRKHWRISQVSVMGEACCMTVQAIHGGLAQH